MPASRRASRPVIALLALLQAALTVVAAPPAAGPAAAVAPSDPDSEEDVEIAPEEAEPGAGVVVDEGLGVVSPDGRVLALRLRLDGSESWRDLAARICGDASRAKALESAGGGTPPADDRVIDVPWDLLRPEYRYLAIRAVFPADRLERGAWEHHADKALLPLPLAGWWQVAVWFTGDGENWRSIASASGVPGPEVPKDRPVRIPERMLLPLFRPVTMGSGGLTYGEDADGPFAEYRMGRGEALYSAVLVRFTELTRPDDVNAAAEVVRQRSGIEDVRKIEVGQRVRVPLDLLSAAYLPDNHPRRVLLRLHEAEIATVARPARALALEGVHVLLDPGHGGDDVGAKNGRLWESDYVFDIACRVQRLLNRETSAHVKLLVRDTEFGCRVLDRRALPRSRRVVVDSTPPTPIVRGATRAAVNRRWSLANEWFHDLTSTRRVTPEHVVFLSLHADSLHRSMRGGTVYVPGERYRRTVPANGNGGRLTLPRSERLRDEAVSRRLAWALLAGYRQENLPIHEDQPVRDHVVRGRSRVWLPAVLRGNLVPAKVLLETVNLGNAEDARILQDPDGRERIARAVVAGLRRFYSGADQTRAADPARVTGTARRSAP